MTIVAFMQCMWVRDPEKHRRLLSTYDGDIPRREKLRRRMIAYALFAGCKSGRVLKDALGDELCEKIIWEESSREVGDRSSAKFDFDSLHARAVLDEFKPDVVLAFGKVASAGLAAMDVGAPVLMLPHPAARGGGVEAELRIAREKLEAMK